MNREMNDDIRERLYKGFGQNPLAQLLKDRAAIRGPIKGSPEEFCEVLCELIGGELNRPNGAVGYAVINNGNKDILKFGEGALFKIVKALGGVTGALIVVTPFIPSKDELLNVRELPFAGLVEKLRIRDAFANAAVDYKRRERKRSAEKASEERRVSLESRFEAVLSGIERARSGQTIMVRGRQNIDELVKIGFSPGLMDNPDNWVDAEDFPALRYRHARSGTVLLLTAREKIQPIEELSRLEFFFLVNRSDDDPASFDRMTRKFRQTKKDGTACSLGDLHAGLMELVKYPEELKGRTEADLGVVAEEVEHVIDKRQVLDKGILPYEAVFSRDTQAIISYILKNRTPAGEIRKALDYFEYTGMIDAKYKATLHQQINAATTVAPRDAHGLGELLYDKRVKEIVSEVLKKIPQGHVTASSVTLALTPYVRELGFGKLVKIRDRILQLKDVLHDEHARFGHGEDRT